MRGYLLLIAALIFGKIGFGQNSVDTANQPVWIDMMQDQNGNFFETQKAFETYWKGRTRTKGDGYKPFKRWEWFMRDEILPDGSYRDPNDIQNSVMQFQSSANYHPSLNGNMVNSNNGKWVNLGPIQKPIASSGQPNGMGRINGIGLHPTNDSIIFIGSPNGGIWRSYDHGTTWESNTDTNFVMQISEIKFHPKNPTIVYAGTGDRDAGARSPRGVMKSVDGGVHWSVSNSGMGNRVVGKLIIDPDKPDTLVAATSGGIYRTTNGGNTWTRTSISSSHFKDIVYNPATFQVQYATSGGDFFRSTDGGQSWSLVSVPVNGQRIAIAVTPDDPSYVYLVQTTRTSFAGLMLSTDSGSTFTTQSTSPNIMDWSTTGSGSGGQAWYDLDIAADPKNKKTIWVGGVNVFRSTDEGKTWRINAHWTGSGGAPAVHADHHVFEWSADGERLYNGNDGGIYFTSNGGSNWTDLSSGIPISEVYKIGQHAYKEDRVICGYQDNGSAIYRGTGNWKTEIGGDGMECAFDYSNDTYVYGALYYGNIRRSRNSGNNFSAITGGISEQGAWVTPYVLDEGDPKIMYVGMTSNIWRTLNVRANSVQWRNISANSGISSTGAFSVLESSPADPNILYAVRSGKTMMRTDNAHAGTPTWVNLTPKLPLGSSPSDVEAHPWNPNIVYITSGSKVHVSTDKGDTWTDITGNLPNTAKRTIVYDKHSRGGIYVGGTPNVYYIDSTLGSWIEYSNGLPGDVSVTELEIFYDTITPINSKLRAGTYGRGLWSVDLFEIEKRLPQAVLRGDTGFYCAQQTLQLFADSSRNGEKFSWIISPDTGFSYVNNTSKSSKNAEIQFSQGGYYSLMLVVSNYFGRDTISLPNSIFIADTNSGYCITSTVASSASNQGIRRVELLQIDKSSATYNGSVSNSNFTCSEHAILHIDSAYIISITTGNGEVAKAYIDYNNDGDFVDAGEEIASFSSGSGRRNANFRTPLLPTVNTALRMRVVSDVSPISGPCGNLTSGESEDYTIVIDYPLASIDFSAAKVCPNQEVEISASTAGKVDSLYWDFGVLASPRFQTGIGPHVVKYSGTGWWKVIVRVNSDRWFEDSIQIIKSPTADIILDSASSSLCEGGFAKLLVVNNSGVAGIYNWYQNGTLLTGKTDSVLIASNLNTFGQYDFQVITGNGTCADTSDTFKIIPHDKPDSWIGLIVGTQCLKGNEFDFRDNSIFIGGSLTRLWKFGDNNTDTSKNAKHSYRSAGIYTAELIVTSDKGCSDTSSRKVYVNANPDSTFSFALVSGLEYEFTPNDTNLQSYKWNFGDSNTSTVKAPKHIYSKGGNYRVQLDVENSNNCNGQASKMVDVEDISDAVELFSKNFGVSVYPNPTHGKVNVEIEENVSFSYELLDLSGRLILSGEKISSENTLEIELSSVGMYLLQINIEGQKATYKIENK